MPLPQEILHNCTIQWPENPLMANDMEMVWDYLIAKKKILKQNFVKSHNVKPLSTLNPGQEVLFLSLADQHSYVPGTINEKVSTSKLHN